MDGNQGAYFLRGIADTVRAMGMAAENQARAQRDEAPAYNDQAFEQVARSIDYYATEMQRG